MFRMLLVLGLLGMMLGLSHAADVAVGGASSATRWNFVVIVVDDWGWRDLSCQGSPWYRTPHIDQLAAEGIRFTNGYSAAPVCSPTRAALLTGRYPARLGLTDWIRPAFARGNVEPDSNPTDYVSEPGRLLTCPPNPFWMEHAEVTLAEVLREAGYATCHVGKWHLGGHAWSPTTQGFDENHGGCDFGQPPSYFDPYVNERLPRGIPTLPARQAGEYLTEREADEAIGFVRAHRDQPFFLYLAHYAVHTPIQAKPDKVAEYEPLRAAGLTSPAYAAMVASVDDAVGRLITTLQSLQIDQRTMVVITSDNGGLDREGDPTDNNPLRSGKGFAYEGGLRVPWIIKWPGRVPAASLSHEPICSIDLFPTLAEVAQVSLTNKTVDGISLVQHLQSGGEMPLARDSLYWHFPHFREGNGPFSVIRQGRWKLIRYYEGPRYELFDLEADLAESHNLAAMRPDMVAQLNQQLTAHLEAVDAKVPR